MCYQRFSSFPPSPTLVYNSATDLDCSVYIRQRQLMSYNNLYYNSITIYYYVCCLATLSRVRLCTNQIVFISAVRPSYVMAIEEVVDAIPLRPFVYCSMRLQLVIPVSRNFFFFILFSCPFFSRSRSSI